jgi:ubiquinol-cytochrome c reductase cytochrome b subunit
VIVPGVAFTALALWPFIEQRMTGDRREHHLLDHPRDAPVRTGVGAAGLVFFAILTLAAGNDVFAIMFRSSVEATTWLFRVALFAAPPVAGWIVYRICDELRATKSHPLAPERAVVLRRNAEGGFEESAS